MSNAWKALFEGSNKYMKRLEEHRARAKAPASVVNAAKAAIDARKIKEAEECGALKPIEGEVAKKDPSAPPLGGSKKASAGTVSSARFALDPKALTKRMDTLKRLGKERNLHSLRGFTYDGFDAFHGRLDKPEVCMACGVKPKNEVLKKSLPFCKSCIERGRDAKNGIVHQEPISQMVHRHRPQKSERYEDEYYEDEYGELKKRTFYDDDEPDDL